MELNHNNNTDTNANQVTTLAIATTTSTQLATTIQNKSKKVTLTQLLSASKRDKKKLKEYLIENVKILPQEYRLTVWSLMLDVSTQFVGQQVIIDSLHKTHYEYLKHIIKNVLKFYSNNNNDESNGYCLNYYIYLLDSGLLPLEKVMDDFNAPFCLLYRQLNEILDDAEDYQYYYLTYQLHECLKRNLGKLKERLHEYFCKETDNSIKNLIEHDRIKHYFLTALAFKFKNLDNYLIIIDRLVIESSCDILIYIIIVIIERIRECQLKELLDSNDYLQSIDQQLGLDETRIRKGIERLTKTFK